MPKIGLKYFVCAPLKETPPPNASVSHDNGFVLAEAISADISNTMVEAQLYADDATSESIKQFGSAAITLNGNNIKFEHMAILFGHKVETRNGVKEMVSKSGDDGTYVGVGFYAVETLKGISKYSARWYHKVKFGTPNETFNTKGDSITFQTPTIVGTGMADVLGVWRDAAEFTDENKVREWLNEKAGISSDSGATDSGGDSDSGGLYDE